MKGKHESVVCEWNEIPSYIIIRAIQKITYLQHFHLKRLYCLSMTILMRKHNIKKYRALNNINADERYLFTLTQGQMLE